MSENVSRRNLFQILGAAVPAAAVAAGSAGALEAQHNHGGKASEQTQAKGPYQRQTFDDHQWQTVRVLCDLIIPADESGPAASAAGVPEYLDDWVAFRTEQDGTQNFRAEILGGLMWIDRESNKLCGKDFVDAGANMQKQLLDRIAYPKKVAKDDHPGMAFFNQFRSLTVSGYFSSKAGVAALPYLGNVAVTEWKGCDPKVWAILEERMKNGYKGIVESKPWDTRTS
ncbi:MAG: gluconate 2-dehydrogenase subunit 3 family protein [Bryobacteraceae bacterium]